MAPGGEDGGAALDFNNLLHLAGIDPRTVLVLRHRPMEPALHRALPWLAAERPDLFAAYQQCQGPRLEQAMRGATHVASFIGTAPARALFVGLFAIDGHEALSFETFWALPAHQALRDWGYLGFTAAEATARPAILRFDLTPTGFHPDWQGRLLVGFPPPERSWWRRAHKNRFPVEAIHETSALTPHMPDWTEIDLAWADLAILPGAWRAALAQWRGIYLVFDSTDGKSYVGSAYGGQNLLGRWQQYATTGHGGNTHLRTRAPESFRFSILERVAPDLPADAVIAIETGWKRRLHTAWPVGLNDT